MIARHTGPPEHRAPDGEGAPGHGRGAPPAGAHDDVVAESPEARPEDPGTEELRRAGYESPELKHVETAETGGRSAWQRLAAASSLKTARSQLMAGLLCAILGFGVVVQVRQTDEDGLSSLSEPDLVRVLDDVTERTNRLESEAESLQKDRDQLESGSDQQALAEQQAKERADSLAILAGTAAATGPGVTIVVSDPEAQVTAADMVNIVQELRDAGAEALQINNTRIVARTAFLPAPNGGVAVASGVLTRPYTVTAIGDSETMATAMKIPGGAEDIAAQRGGSMSITTANSLDVTAVVPDDGSDGTATDR